jgi:hypothetical protein
MGHRAVLDGTLARIAAGTADSTILRAADVFLKERREADPRPARKRRGISFTPGTSVL